MSNPYAIDYSQYGPGSYGDYGSTPPPGMLDPRTLVSGFGGYSYGEQEGQGPGATGTPNIIKGGFPMAASYLLKGSQGAHDSALKGFESGFRARAEGIASGFGAQQDQLGGEVASQGYNPDLVRRMLAGGRGSSQAAIGSARAEADQGFQMYAAELLHNTGRELATLKREELHQLVQGFIARQARRAGTQAGWTAFAGNVLGAGATVAGGGAT